MYNIYLRSSRQDMRRCFLSSARKIISDNKQCFPRPRLSTKINCFPSNSYSQRRPIRCQPIADSAKPFFAPDPDEGVMPKVRLQLLNSHQESITNRTKTTLLSWGVYKESLLNGSVNRELEGFQKNLHTQFSKKNLYPFNLCTLSCIQWHLLEERLNFTKAKNLFSNS